MACLILKWWMWSICVQQLKPQKCKFWQYVHFILFPQLSFLCFPYKWKVTRCFFLILYWLLYFAQSNRIHRLHNKKIVIVPDSYCGNFYGLHYASVTAYYIDKYLPVVQNPQSAIQSFFHLIYSVCLMTDSVSSLLCSVVCHCLNHL